MFINVFIFLKLGIEIYFKMEEKEVANDKIGQSQVYDLITGDRPSWQTIIYDLIKTEQLDPWDINLVVLSKKYIEVIEQMEEANFFISSKVLLACSLLLRLKSEILVNSYIEELNDALYGVKEKKEYKPETIEIDEDEIPILIPRTPMPRFKKVTLQQLMFSLNKAIETETRRIRKEIRTKQAEKSALVVLPKRNHIPLKSRIKSIYEKIKNYLDHPEKNKMKYSELAQDKEAMISCFLPILHLSNDEKLWLHQEKHFDEIHMSCEDLESDEDVIVEDV